MGLARNLAADLDQVHLHGLGIGVWHEEGCTRAPCWANGPEYVGILIALISRLPWSCAAPCPQTCPAILLANASFILPPDFDWFIIR
jgi:hypothetical protein